MMFRWEKRDECTQNEVWTRKNALQNMCKIANDCLLHECQIFFFHAIAWECNMSARASNT